LDKLVKIWAKFDQIWAKIKILHPPKHSGSYGYGDDASGLKGV